MKESASASSERVLALRRALGSPDETVRRAGLREVLAASDDPETVAVVPVLLRALARGTAPETEIVHLLRTLGLRRVAAVVGHHMPELIEAARDRIEPPDEDLLDELPALD